MITPEEALKRILALSPPLSGEEMLPLMTSLGRIVARPVIAKRTQPSRDLSAMDGYAVRYADLPGPWRIVGESAAGRPSSLPCRRGEALRIFAGAAVPHGADCIVIQEEASRDGDVISFTGDRPPSLGMHIRQAGCDFAAGDSLIEAGDAMTPARIALAALGGHASVSVRPRIRVALVSTGDELVPLGEDAGDDRLPSANAPMLAALLTSVAADVTDCGIVRDHRGALVHCLSQLNGFDIVVTIGGASVGDHDLVRPALIDAGATLDFWKIAMRPGKPVLAGRLEEAVVLGLPGNPVSAFVTALLFLIPLVRHLSGEKQALPRRGAATLAAPLPANSLRADYVRAIVSDGVAMPLAGDSSMMSALASANALIEIPPYMPAQPAGASVTIISLT